MAVLLQIADGILKNAPVWVWPLLCFLIVIGWISSRDRKSSIYIYYFLPFIGFTGFGSIASLSFPIVAWGGFLIGYLLGSIVGYRKQANWVISKDGNALQLKGEWFTMLAVMVTFWMNFVSGTVKAVSPSAHGSPVFVLLFVCIVGIASGTFLGRSLKIIRF